MVGNILILLLGFLICPTFGSVCNHVTDIIIMIESKSPGAGNTPIFDKHRDTALSIVHRLPMEKDHVRVTVVQFSDAKSKIEVIFDDSRGSRTGGGSQIYKQKKSEVLERISLMLPLRNVGSDQTSGNLVGAMKLVSGVILPKILKNDSQDGTSSPPRANERYSKIILVTIVSGYWVQPDITELARVYLKLSKQGVLSYIAAYDMKGKPSDSILPQIVSKPHFLILPKPNQNSAVGGHLADAFQVCWKDGPCWPNNPCHYGCECVGDANAPDGYQCESHGPFWLASNCTKPAPWLACGDDLIELRLPKHFVTRTKTPPVDIDVYSGISDKWPKPGESNECIAKVIEHAYQDPGSSQRSLAILHSEGFYYLIKNSIGQNSCQLSFITDKENGTLKIESTIFKSRKPLPSDVRMDVPVMKMQCVYPANLKGDVGVQLESVAGKSVRKQDFIDMAQNDESVSSILSRPVWLNGYEFDYPEWKRTNPFADPDEVTELIEQHGGLDAIARGVKLGIIPVVRRRVYDNPNFGSFAGVQRKSPRHKGQDCGTGFKCHCGPFEKGDPCNPNYRYLTTPEPTTKAIETTLPVTTTQPVPTTVYNSVIKMKLYKDKGRTEEIGPEGAPAGSTVFVYVGPDKGSDPTPGVCPYVRACWMEVNTTNSVQPTRNSSDTSLTIVEDGCPLPDNAVGLRMMDNGRSPSSQFSFQSVRFRDFDGSFGYYIQCNITVCDCSSGSCATNCSNPYSRTRRSVDDGGFSTLRITLLITANDDATKKFP